MFNWIWWFRRKKILEDVKWSSRRSVKDKVRLSRAIVKIRQGIVVDVSEVAIMHPNKSVEVCPIEVTNEFIKQDPNFAERVAEFRKEVEELSCESSDIR